MIAAAPELLRRDLVERDLIEQVGLVMIVELVVIGFGEILELEAGREHDAARPQLTAI